MYKYFVQYYELVESHPSLSPGDRTLYYRFISICVLSIWETQSANIKFMFLVDGRWLMVEFVGCIPNNLFRLACK